MKIFQTKTVNNNAHQRKQIKIFGIKFTFKTKEWLEAQTLYNIEQNKINLGFNKPAGNKNILFIASNFVQEGGIETRLRQYIEKLSPEGFNVFILSEDNKNKFLSEQTNFYLSFDAPNFNNCLIEIIKNYNINFIEFQFKNSKILKKLNLDVIKKYSVVGCTLHNTGIKNIKLINKLDYAIIVSNYLYQNHYKKIKNSVIIQNAIDFSKFDNIYWEHKNQNTALLISRVAQDKLNSIECFINYCKKHNIKFKIAGEENSDRKVKDKLKVKYGLTDDIFIGKIDTIPFLSAHMDDFLFVAGVGLVILEAGALNYPVFVCSDTKGECYSFVTKENVDLFDNFTINKKSPVIIKQKKENLLKIANIEFYQLKGYIQIHRRINSYIDIYLKSLNCRNVEENINVQ